MSAQAGQPVDLDVVRTFLSLRRDETVELVSMPLERGSSATTAKAFTLPAELDAAVAWVAREAVRPARTVSVGIGCLTPAAAARIGAPGGWARAGVRNAEAEGIDLLLGYLWVAVDIDADKENPQPVGELFTRLHPLPKPTVFVASGTGLHAWWQLTRVARPAEGRALLEVLARAVDGDSGTTQEARALRLPGTYNAKPAGQRLAVMAPGATEPYDPRALLAAVEAVAPAPPAPPPAVVRPPRPTYEGTDLKEVVRARYDLPTELDRLCGPARRGDWSCFAHEDRTPSLRLVLGADQVAMCRGGSHPDGVGLHKDGGYVLDVFDLLAWENGVSTARLMADLITAERARQPAAPRVSVTSPGLPQLDAVLRATASSA